MDGLALIIQTRALNLTKYVAYKTLEYLVEVTPVDTSKAESNWRIALGGTSWGATPIPAYVLGSGGSSREASARAALAAGKAALKGAVAGKPIAVINVVPYIERLNAGSSTQAPAGFVERAVLVGKQAVKEYNFEQRLKQDFRRGRVSEDTELG
jgi:hypothetical protein